MARYGGLSYSDYRAGRGVWRFQTIPLVHNGVVEMSGFENGECVLFAVHLGGLEAGKGVGVEPDCRGRQTLREQENEFGLTICIDLGEVAFLGVAREAIRVF